jgi:transcription initiation factor TFIID subunit 6
MTMINQRNSPNRLFHEKQLIVNRPNSDRAGEVLNRRRSQNVMAVPASHLTVQVIADSLGLRIADSPLVSNVERIGESFIRDFLRDVSTLYQSTRSYRLTTTHIEMVIESRNFGPLQGYHVVPSYLLQPVTIDQSDLYGVKEPLRPLADVVTERTTLPPHSIEHRPKWTVIEGAYCGWRFVLPRRREIPRPTKLLERSASTPNVPIHPQFECPRPGTGEQERTLASLDRETLFANDKLCGELQQFFIQTINLLKADHVQSLDAALAILTEEDKLQGLLPYFLQWAFGQMTLRLGNPGEIIAVIRCILALANNRSIDIGLYCHAFLKLAITALLAASCGSCDDQDVRKFASRLMCTICNRCEPTYPAIKPMIINALTNSLFSTATSLATHYGALLGLRDLDYHITESTARFYLAIVRSELQSLDGNQRTWAGRIVALLKT